jgi:predicted DNA-binding protein YlxM (UPF0122 family)
MRQQGNKNIHTVQQFAAKQGINRSTVYKQVKAGKLNTETIDGVLHIVEIVSTLATDDVKDALMRHLEEEVSSLRSQLEELQKTNTKLLEELSYLRQDAEESRRRADILLIQLQEYLTRPWWKKLLGRRQLPAPLETITKPEA